MPGPFPDFSSFNSPAPAPPPLKSDLCRDLATTTPSRFPVVGVQQDVLRGLCSLQWESSAVQHIDTLKLQASVRGACAGPFLPTGRSQGSLSPMARVGRAMRMRPLESEYSEQSRPNTRLAWSFIKAPLRRFRSKRSSPTLKR